MGKYIVTGPNGQEFEFEGDSAPTETDLEAAFSGGPDTVEQSPLAGSPLAGETKNLPGDSLEPAPEGTFNLGAAADQAGNIARQVVGGVADVGAGLVDTATLPFRLAGADIPSYQEELKKERAGKDNSYAETKASTEVNTYEPLKGIIGETFNPANFLGQLLGASPLAIGTAVAARAGGLGAAGAGAVGGAVEGAVGGVTAPTQSANPQEELQQRATGGALGAVLGGPLGALAGKVASRFSKHSEIAVDTASADLEAVSSFFDNAADTLAAARQHVIDNPHAETNAAYDIARAEYLKAEAAVEKQQGIYDKAIKKYGLPKNQNAAPQAATEPVPTPPAPEELGLTKSNALITPEPQSTAITRTALVTPPPQETNPFAIAPNPRSANGQSPYQHTPQSLDTEIKRALVQNYLGESSEEISATMRAISSNKEYSSYAQENFARLQKEAREQLDHEIQLRYGKAEQELLNSPAYKELSDGKTQGQGQESDLRGDSGRPEVRSENGEASAQTEFPSDSPAGRTDAISKLSTFPGPIFDWLKKSANPVGKVQLNAAQRQAMQSFPGKVVDNPDELPYIQRMQAYAKQKYDELKPALTHRFGAIQDLGDESVGAVDRYYGMSAEAGSYLLGLGAKIKEELGVDPDLLKGFNEYLVLKRLEGRGRNNPADPLLLKRFGQTSQYGIGGNTQVADHLNLMQGANPQAFAAYEKLNTEVRNLVDNIHTMHVESGTIAQDTIDAFTQADPNYLPFASMSKALEEAQAMVHNGKKLGVNSVGSLIKKVSDYNGPQHTDDRAPLDNLIAFVEQSTKAIRRNEVVGSVVNNPDSGALPFTGQTRAGYVPVSHLVNGEPVEYLVPEDIARAFTHLDPVQAQGLGKFVQSLTRLQTGLATGYNPVFSVVQALKDIPTAIAQNPDIAGGIIKGIPAAAKATFTEAVTGKQTPLMQEFYQAGAGGSFVNEFKKPSVLDGKADRLRSFGDEYLPKNLAQAVVAKPLSSPFTVVGRANTAIDNIPRVAAFRARQAQALAKGATSKEAQRQAVHTGRNATIDFAEGGYLTKQLNAIVPFANVAFQGPALAYGEMRRNFRDNPKALAAVVGSMVVMPELVLWGNNHSTPDKKKVWDDISQYEKDTNYIFVAHGDKDANGRYTGILKLPINDSYKALRNSVREGAEFAFFQDRNNLGQAIRSAANMLPGAQNLAPVEASQESNEFFGTGLQFTAGPLLNNLPILLKQSAAITSNYDSFRQDKIIKDKATEEIGARGTSDEKQQAYKGSTTASGKLFARTFNLLPEQGDYFLKSSIFAGAGETFGGIIDGIVETAQPHLKPTNPKEVGLKKQFSRRFFGASGGAQESRDARTANSAVVANSLNAVQEKNISREIEAVLKDTKISPEAQGEKLGVIANKIAKLQAEGQPTKDFETFVEKAAARVAFPADQFIYDLKRMNKSDAFEAIVKKLESYQPDDPEAANFVQTLEANDIPLDPPEDYVPKAERDKLKISDSRLQGLPTKRTITDLGGGLFKVRDPDGRTRTVRKENNQFTVIG